MGAADWRFVNPEYLPLIAIPILMLVVWVWRFFWRRSEVNAYKNRRALPLKEKYLFAGPLFFWFCLTLAVLLAIVALSRPQVLSSIVENNPVDLVVIYDGSASMYVKDVKPDRWGRSISWLKVLVETLPWKGDRLALAAFAHRASPMIRLTSDPNVAMFFIDHLKESPFRLNDNPTWDTNIEEGMYWGLKILEKDLQFYGRRGNPQAFILISDGQAWSGRVENLFRLIGTVGPVYVIGVGTTAGGPIPLSGPQQMTRHNDFGQSVGSQIQNVPTVYSSIDRQSLRNIALASGGEYFELDTESDPTIAARIINKVQRQNISRSQEKIWEDWYWYFLTGAAVFLVVGTYGLFR